jgi:hypothetical protein
VRIYGEQPRCIRCPLGLNLRELGLTRVGSCAATQWMRLAPDGTSGERAGAVQQSLGSKTHNSYYYAHHRRETGERAAPAPHPDGVRLHAAADAAPAAVASSSELPEQSAYYYAHAQRSGAEPPAPAPVAGGWVLDTTTTAAALPVVTIETVRPALRVPCVNDHPLAVALLHLCRELAH